MSSESELPAGDVGPITATVTRRAKPGHEEAYGRFLADIGGAAKTFPGIAVKRSSARPAAGGGEYRIVYRFS